jgi:hypothetical protein
MVVSPRSLHGVVAERHASRGSSSPSANSRAPLFESRSQSRSPSSASTRTSDIWSLNSPPPPRRYYGYGKLERSDIAVAPARKGWRLRKQCKFLLQLGLTTCLTAVVAFCVARATRPGEPAAREAKPSPVPRQASLPTGLRTDAPRSTAGGGGGGRGNAVVAPAVHQSQSEAQMAANNVSAAAELHRCEIDYDHWEVAWMLEKKIWCCRQTGRGCDPYDCKEEFSNWQVAWTPKKQVWCCQHHRLGCPDTSSAPAVGRSDTSGAPAAGRRITPAEASHLPLPPKNPVQRSLTVQEAGPTTPRPAEYTCNADAPSAAETHWCCHTLGLLCSTQHPSTTVSPSAAASDRQIQHADCSTGEEASWPLRKRVWCCLHSGRACRRWAPALQEPPSSKVSVTPDQPRGCALTCTMANESISCGERVRYAAAHEFRQQADACVTAHHFVLQQCGACADCDLQTAACVNPKPLLSLPSKERGHERQNESPLGQPLYA